MKAMKKYQDGGSPKRRTVKFTKETLETGKKGKPTKQRVTKTVTKQTKKGTKTKTKEFTLDKGARRDKIKKALSVLGIAAGIAPLAVTPAFAPLSAGAIAAGRAGIKGKGKGKVRTEKGKTIKFEPAPTMMEQAKDVLFPSMQEGGMVEEAETKGQARRRIRREDRDFKRATKRANREQEQVMSPSMDAEIEAQDPVTPTRDNTPSNFPKTYTAFKQMWRSSDAGRQGVPAPSRSEFRKMKTKNQIKAIEEAKEAPKPTRKDRVLDRKMKRALKEGEKMMEASPIIEADEPDADDFSRKPIELPKKDLSKIESPALLDDETKNIPVPGKEEEEYKALLEQAIKDGELGMLDADDQKAARKMGLASRRDIRKANKGESYLPEKKETPTELSAVDKKELEEIIPDSPFVKSDQDAVDEKENEIVVETPETDKAPISTITTSEDKKPKKRIFQNFLQEFKDARKRAMKTSEEQGLRTKRDIRKFGRFSRRGQEYDEGKDINIDKTGMRGRKAIRLEGARVRQQDKTARQEKFNQPGEGRPKVFKNIFKGMVGAAFPIMSAIVDRSRAQEGIYKPGTEIYDAEGNVVGGKLKNLLFSGPNPLFNFLPSSLQKQGSAGNVEFDSQEFSAWYETNKDVMGLEAMDPKEVLARYLLFKQ